MLCYKMWVAIKLLFRRNFIALNDCIRKEENEMRKNKLRVQHKKQKKHEQINSKQLERTDYKNRS